MSEMAKTLLFVALAVGSLFFAFFVGPSSDSIDFDEFIGLRLNEFEVDQAKRLEVVKFDAETAATHEFEIAEVDGLWTIPSKQGYPADANKRMAAAVNNVIDREILRIAAHSSSEHETLGVLNPESSKLNSKTTGAGTRVVISDVHDNVLSDMIIGKPVPDSEDQYHVRDTDKDLVYVVNLNPENLSTSFKDWIEGDLLKLNPLDLQLAEIHDYSTELRRVLTANGVGTQVLWDRRGEMTFEYDNSKSEWNAKRLQKFDPAQEKLVEFELTEDEELNKDALQELRDSLEGLLIVDVERKPAGLSADLQAGEDFLNNEDAVDSLRERGFAAVPLVEGAEPEILSSEGQLICSMKDGIEYVLRFGNLKADSQETSAADASAQADGSETEAATAGSDIYRYLFVMARFNELLLASPELEEFPDLPEGVTEEDLKAAAEAAASAAQSQDSEADDVAPSDDSSTAKEEEEEEEEEDAPEEDVPEVEASESPASTDSVSDSVSDATSDSASDAKPEEKTEDKAEEMSADEKEDRIGQILAIREGIKQENERHQNEYQEKIAAGQKRVKELNERFGDWYYVIDNEVYKKIHLGSDQLIKKKEKEAAAETDSSAPAASSIPGLPQLPAGGAPK